MGKTKTGTDSPVKSTPKVTDPKVTVPKVKKKLPYEVRLIIANHPTGVMLIKKDGVDMQITRKWKPLNKRTKRLAEWEKKKFIAIRAVKK